MAGCNWVPFRNLLTSLGIISGFAATSALFAAGWERFGGFPIVTAVSYGAAAAWASAAMLLVGFAISALTTFCRCAAGIPACAVVCAILRPLLMVWMGLLVSLFALATVLATDIGLVDSWPVAALLVAAIGILVAIGFSAFYGARLVSCQG